MKLKVESVHPNGVDFICRDQDNERHTVDLFVNGDLPENTQIQDLVGKTVGVDELLPYIEIAFGVKILDENS